MRERDGGRRDNLYIFRKESILAADGTVDIKKYKTVGCLGGLHDPTKFLGMKKQSPAVERHPLPLPLPHIHTYTHTPPFFKQIESFCRTKPHKTKILNLCGDLDLFPAVPDLSPKLFPSCFFHLYIVSRCLLMIIKKVKDRAHQNGNFE